MRLIILITIISFYSCENKKETNASRLQAIRHEMEDVKNFYYHKMDSLENVRERDINSMNLFETAEEIRSLDGKRSTELLKLQKEYDSIAAKIK